MTISTLSQAGMRIGFPQGKHFDAIIMTEYMQRWNLGKTYTPSRQPKFYFPFSFVVRNQQIKGGHEKIVPFGASAVSVFYEMSYDDILRYVRDNPRRRIAYVPDRSAPGGTNPTPLAPNIIIPVAHGVTRDDMWNIDVNLENARYWFSLAADNMARTAALSKIDGQKPSRVGFESAELLRHQRDFVAQDDIIVPAARKMARHFLGVAYGIYARFAPPEEPAISGSHPWRPRVPVVQISEQMTAHAA